MNEITNDNQTAKYKYKSYTMILPLYNEESRVRRVVKYYKPFARLIAIDNFSTDRTVEILKELDVEVVQYKNPGTTQTPECLKFMTSLVDTDYILFLACSEFMPSVLLHLFEEVAASQKYDIVSSVRDSYTCGELIPLWGGRSRYLEARVERFFKKDAVDLDQVVIHGNFVPFNKNRVLNLPRDERYLMAHLRDVDTVSLLKKIIEYANVEARHRAANGNPLSLSKLVLLLMKEVVRFFLLPVSVWGSLALREVWARMIMHSVTYWVGKELTHEKLTLDYSHKANADLWERLVDAQQKHLGK